MFNVPPSPGRRVLRGAVRSGHALKRSGRNPLPHHQRTDLDRAQAGRRNPRRNCHRVIQIFRLDQVEAAQLFLGLRERSIGDQFLTIAHPDRGRLRHRMQLAAREVVPALLDALGQLTILLHHFALLGFVEFSPLALLVVDQKQILHVIGPPCPSPDSRTASPIIDNPQKCFPRGFRARVGTGALACPAERSSAALFLLSLPRSGAGPCESVRHEDPHRMLHSSPAPPVPLLTSNQLPPCKTPASSSPLTVLPAF